MKTAARKILNTLGLQVSRIPKIEDHLALHRRIYSPEAIANKRFYNIGAGSFSHPYWTNIDYLSDWYSGVQKNVVHYDLMKCEPLPIDEAELLYTSHTIEHVSEAAVANLFKEASRVLKPGGIFRVTTGPDADLDYAAMKRGDTDYFYWDKDYDRPGTYEHIYHRPPASVPIEERWLHHVASELAPNNKSPSPTKLDAAAIREVIKNRSMEQALDYLTGLCSFNPERPGNHISWWNKEKTMRFLRDAGFNNVYMSGFGQSHSAVMRNVRFFDNTHPPMSLYVEAVKT